MKTIRKIQPTRPFEWELLIFGCRFCGTLWKFETQEEADASLEMWGMGAFAYFSVCPKCSKKAAVEVPFYPEEEALFKYIYELEEKAAKYDDLCE